MSFSAAILIAGEICKVVFPSLLAFFAWWQSRGNEKGIIEVKKKVNMVDEKTRDTSDDIVRIKDGVHELRITVDGRLSQLLKLTESSAFARGMLEPKAENSHGLTPRGEDSNIQQ